jgi:hypothetical protein
MPAPSLSTEALGLYVERQLMDQSRRIYDPSLPPLNAYRLMPNQGTVAQGARQYNRRIYQQFGQSQWISNSADDLPRVGLGVIEDVYNVAMHGVSYGYGLQEVRAAAFAGEDLDAKLPLAARRAIEEFNNNVAFYGSVTKRLTGLLSVPYIPRVGLSAALFAAGANPLDTIAAVISLETQVLEQSNDAEVPDTYLFASPVYDYLATTPASTLNPELTILQVILNNSQHAKRAERVRELTGAGPASENIIACISTGNDRLEHNLPDPLTLLEIQSLNLEWRRPVVSETAGVISEFPYAHVIAELS